MRKRKRRAEHPGLRPRRGGRAAAAARRRSEQQKLRSAPDLAPRAGEAARTGRTPGAAVGCTGAPAKPDASKFPEAQAVQRRRAVLRRDHRRADRRARATRSPAASRASRTLFLNDLSYMGNPLGLPPDNHANVAHTYNASPLGNNGRPRRRRSRDLAAAREVQPLQLRQDRAADAEAGRSWASLDSTLIYASERHGQSVAAQHAKRADVACGGAGGTKFRMGRRLKMAADCTDQPLVRADATPSSRRARTTTCWSRSRRRSA